MSNSQFNVYVGGFSAPQSVGWPQPAGGYCACAAHYRYDLCDSNENFSFNGRWNGMDVEVREERGKKYE